MVMAIACPEEMVDLSGYVIIIVEAKESKKIKLYGQFNVLF